MHRNHFKALRIALALTTALSLSACAGIMDRMSYLNKPPALSDIKNPVAQKGYTPVTMPMPQQLATNPNPNALWQPGRQTFFKDQRANKVGDLLTVLITIADQADMENKTQRTRDATENVGMPNFMGLETLFHKVLPHTVDPTNLISTNSASTSTGDGQIQRHETISLKLSGTITQVLPNGNFVLVGSQEVRVNADLRQLTLTGVIRPEDILNNNSISYEKIADARISYGGKGETSDIQIPRYGEQFFDAVSPF